MKEIINVTLLGILQGIAEFLPISSSGHLVIGQHLLGMNVPGIRLDVFLHLGTLAAIFIYYRATIARVLGGLLHWQKDAVNFALRIILSCIPAIIVYAIFKDHIEEIFENARIVGSLLIFTGLMLCSTRFMPRGEKDVNWVRALIMGVAQSIALLPGISRSGTTLAAARMSRVDAAASAEFSFLMSAPLIMGAALLELKDAFTQSAAEAAQELSWGVVSYAALIAAVVGYFSLVLLVKTLKGKFFWLFGPYCLVAGLLVWFFCK